MDYGPSGFTVNGISHARILEWVATSFSRGSSQPRDLSLLRWQMDSLFRSDQISRSVVSNSLRPHESQHARPPCPSATPGIHWDSRPSSQWCHPAISSSVVPFSSCPQSLPALESFPMSQLFAWGGQGFSITEPVRLPSENSHVAPDIFKMNTIIKISQST